MMRAFATVVTHDVSIAWRRRGDIMASVLFFAIVSSLFPLAIDPDPQQLRALGPGILWMSALLASMLSLSRLFVQPHADGSLDQFLLSPHPLALLVLAKICAHWLTTAVPLLIVAPLSAQQYTLSTHGTLQLTASLLLGTPALSLIGAVGAALTLGVRGGGVLLCVLVLPLTVPVLVFGASAGAGAEAGLDVTAHFSLLGAYLALCLLCCPLAAAAGLRIAME